MDIAEKIRTIITNTQGRNTMKKSIALWGALVLVGLMLGGCKKDNGTGPDDTTPAGVTDEQSALKYMAATDPFVQNEEETFSDRAVEAQDYGTFGKIDASIIPVRYGRFINNVERTETITMLPGDTVSIVNVQKTIHGTFIILAKLQASDTTFTLIQKPFIDHASRNMIFRRISRDGGLMTRWIPVATSLVEGATTPPADPGFKKIALTKLQFFSPKDTITVTDPDTTYLRYDWNRWMGRKRMVPELRGGDRFSLQATVVSASPDTDLVLLRFGAAGTWRKRLHLILISQTDNGDGTFTRVYQTPPFMYVHFHTGFFHMGVDAVTRGTVLDDQEAYSASWWGVPYRVF